MGYDSTGTGLLIAVPALPEDVIKPWRTDPGMLLQAENVNNETVGILADGSIGVIGDSKTMFAMPDEEFRGDPTDEITALANLCKKHGCLLNGVVKVQGEEPHDIWKVVVVDNVVAEQHPELVWPDGTTGW